MDKCHDDDNACPNLVIVSLGLPSPVHFFNEATINVIALSGEIHRQFEPWEMLFFGGGGVIRSREIISKEPASKFGQVSDSQQTQNIYITFIQRRPNVFDVGPTLYKCHTNVLCLLGYCCFPGDRWESLCSLRCGMVTMVTMMTLRCGDDRRWSSRHLVVTAPLSGVITGGGEYTQVWQDLYHTKPVWNSSKI